jgi:hypothetical protein
MTVTFIDPPSSVIGKTEALDFTASAEVVAISVGYGAVRDEERVYRDGAFLRSYTRSTKVGNTYSVVRDGGWPANPQLYVDELPAVPGPQLQPLLGSPVAAWSLINGSLADRSGNGNTLSVAQLPVPDYYAGQTCYGDGNAAVVSNSAPLRLVGPLTLTFRYFTANYGPFTVAGLFTSSPDSQPGSNSSSWASWVATLATDGPELRSSSWGASMPFQSGSLNGKWYTCCLRRDTNGTGFRDWRGTKVSSGFTGGPAPAAAGNFYLNAQYGGGASSACRSHGLADVMLWNRMLSDAEVAVQLAGMGVAP